MKKLIVVFVLGVLVGGAVAALPLFRYKIMVINSFPFRYDRLTGVVSLPFNESAPDEFEKANNPFE